MKITIQAGLTGSIFCLFIALAGCRNIASDKNSVQIQDSPADMSEAADDPGAALDYEFNMLKDPATGKIPEGIYDQEMAQARDILMRQNQSGRIFANSYLFQGPDNLGGRTRAIVFDVRYNGSSNRILLAGGASGGVYKSIDDGATWVRKSPAGQHFSCTSIAQDPRPGFQDTWYYTVGEAVGNSANGSGAFYSGNGVYKSIDNGETWSRLTNSNTSALETFTVPEDYITRVIVDPTDGFVYTACAASIKRSMDGGGSWAAVLPGSLTNSNQFTDIVVTSTGILYAAFAGTNSSTVDGVWTSQPGPTSGDVGNWTRIAGAGAGGSPTGWNAEGGYGRIVLGIAPSLESRVYALYWNGTTSNCAGTPAPEAELFRWDNTGGTWTDLSANLPDEGGCLNGNDPFAVQTGYDLVIAVKPDNPDCVFIGGTNIYRSTDGFTTTANTARMGGYGISVSYQLYANSHPDIHVITFLPTNSNTLLCGDDGGIQITTDDLNPFVTWSQMNTGYRTYQYYYVAIDPRVANNKVIGGAQDNGTTRNVGGTGTTYENILSGDGCAVGLSDLISGTQYEYVTSQSGFIYRRTAVSSPGSATNITPTGETNSGLFVTYFKLDPDNSENLYYANDNIIYRTTSASTVTSGTWTSMTGIATSVGAANDVSAIGLSRGTYNAATSSMFVGTSNGKLYRLDDPVNAAAATAPVDISGAAFPAGFISCVAVNPRHDDTILVTFSNYGVSSIFWTGNANAATPTWSNVEGALSLPSYRSAAIHVVPNTTEVQYYAGTSVGLYKVTGLPGVTTWAQEASSTLGNAVVSCLSYRPSDGNMLVGTHGYGMWKTNLSLFALPVEMTSFTGSLQGKSALLQWSTSAEYNSRAFELEKSSDGIHFRKLAVIPAAGQSQSPLSYSYTDREPLTEKNYYRLQTLDLDGARNASNTVLVKYTGIRQDMLVMGNPVRSQLQVRFNRETEKAGDLKVTDLSGRELLHTAFGKGQQTVSIGMGSLPAGVYMVKAYLDGLVYVRKFILTR